MTSKARALLDEMSVAEFHLTPEEALTVAEDAMGAGGKFSPYRNKTGEMTTKAQAVLFLGDDGEWYRFKSGKKGKKVDFNKCGRSARDDGKNVRCWDGAKDPE